MRFHRIQALLLKYLYITVNRVDRIFDIFYWPVIDIFVWGFATSFIEQISEYNLISMLLGGIILWMFVWRSTQDIAVYVLEDFWSRDLYHIHSSPATLSEIVASIILLGIGRSAITFAFLSFIAWLFYSFSIFAIPILYIASSVFILSLFGWAIGLFVTSLIFRYGQRIQVLAWSTVWIIQPFSCVFYPKSALPPWAAALAGFLPTTHIFEGLRAAIATGKVIHSKLLYPLAASLVFFFLMAWFLKSSFKKAKKTGILARAD